MKKNKILIVDDNKALLDALRLLLKEEFEVIRTISGPTQLYGELEKGDLDVVLLDMNFKAGMNTGNEGLYWLREIKKKNPLVEVVMITAYGDAENYNTAMRLGADDFLTKPVEFNLLKEKLKAIQ